MSLLALGVLLSLFVGRLVQLQGVDAAAYDSSAGAHRTQKVELLATRGDITDASGDPLAVSVDAVDVTADPTQVKRPDATAAALAPILGVDAGRLRALLSTPHTRYVLLAKQVTPQAWQLIKSRQSDPGGAVYAGVYDVPHAKRVYPDSDLAANVVGFVNGQGVGAGGLEYALNSVLAGHNGSMSFQAVGGQEIATAGVSEQAPVAGRGVRLTLNRDIQWVAQQAIADQVRAAGASSGTVVVEDAHTGAILALATAPGYNPNDLAHASSADLGNRALSEVYEPGSVSKVMTMAAAIQEGVATPDTHVTVPGTLTRAHRVFHDDVDHGTWRLTLTGVLAKSSNIGTMLTAERLGGDKLYDYLRAFGVGAPTGLDFPGESPGILPPPGQWSDSQRYTIPFGQGLSLNAVQATSVFATIANGGVRVSPTLVQGYQGADGRLTPAPPPTRTRVVSPSTARAVSDMMESVVSDDGTAPMAQIPGYRVAGKTGTANRVDPACGCYRGYTASFIGFAPADQASLVVSVTIQNPTGASHFGGVLGGPVFKRVMSFALQTLHIPPTGTKPPNLPVQW